MTEAEEKQLEFRICWSASSNIGFCAEGEWHEANPGESTEEIEDGLCKGAAVSDGLEIAINESGFEWWVETREQGADQ